MRSKKNSKNEKKNEKGCQVYGCNSFAKSPYNARPKQRIRLHSFPKDFDRRKKWLIACRRHDLLDIDISCLRDKKICSIHFEPKMYNNPNDIERTTLRYDAYPTLRLEASPVPFQGRVARQHLPSPNVTRYLDVPNEGCSTSSNFLSLNVHEHLTREQPPTELPLEIPTTESFLEIPTIELPLEIPTTGSSLEIPTTELPLEIPTSESSLEIPTTESSLEIPTTGSSLEIPTAELPLEIPTSESSLEIPTAESPLEISTAESSMDLPTTESSLEIPTLELPEEN